MKAELQAFLSIVNKGYQAYRDPKYYALQLGMSVEEIEELCRSELGVSVSRVIGGKVIARRSHMSVKELIRSGELVNVVRMPMTSTEEDVAHIIERDQPDILYIDSQHGPYTEHDIVRICTAAEQEGIGVQMRIKHTRFAFLCGNFADLGLLGIKVPEVKCVDEVREAVHSFYFPPFGGRSWGGNVGYGVKRYEGDMRGYADWWNQNGFLGLKIESIKAVLNVRQLVIPGVDYVDFGPSDLTFDIDKQKHPDFQSVDDCKEFVIRQLSDVDVRIM